MSEQIYYIASLKHTHNHSEHITFWGKDWRGYVLAIANDRIGTYPESEFGMTLNDGVDTIAVPIDVVHSLLSPAPYYASCGIARPFYDIAGPVVDNTRANWNRLIAAAVPSKGAKPKPTVFRGKRASFAMPVAAHAQPSNQSNESDKP